MIIIIKFRMSSEIRQDGGWVHERILNLLVQAQV